MALTTATKPHINTTSKQLGLYSDNLSMPSMYKNAIAGSRVLITGVSETRLDPTASLTIASASPSQLILSSRNAAHLRTIASQIAAHYPEVDVKLLPMDLRSLASVRKAAFELEKWGLRVDVLVNEGAIMPQPQTRRTDSDDSSEDDDEQEDYESSFEVCHLGHFLLTNLLLRAGLLSDCEEVGEDKDGSVAVYERREVYDQAEKANMLFSVALSNAWNLQMRNILRLVLVDGEQGDD